MWNGWGLYQRRLKAPIRKLKLPIRPNAIKRVGLIGETSGLLLYPLVTVTKGTGFANEDNVLNAFSR